MSVATFAQVNVRMERELKERGDATLSLAGSSPARVIRQLWKCLADGGDAYERVMSVLSPVQEAIAGDEARLSVQRSANLFQELGTSLGVNISTFTPDLRNEHEILENIEWELLAEKELV